MKYSNVQYIVVDPSCSGSGIVSRMDNFIDDAEDKRKKEVRLGTNKLQYPSYLL